MSKHYVGDVGVDINVDCNQDVSTATTATIFYRKPDGTTASWAGTPTGNYIQYTTATTDDLDVAGKWELQAHFTIDGWTGYSDTTAFDIMNTHD